MPVFCIYACLTGLLIFMYMCHSFSDQVTLYTPKRGGLDMHLLPNPVINNFKCLVCISYLNSKLVAGNWFLFYSTRRQKCGTLSQNVRTKQENKLHDRFHILNTFLPKKCTNFESTSKQPKAQKFHIKLNNGLLWHIWLQEQKP